MHQLLERLPGTGHRFEGEVGLGVFIELLAMAVADQGAALAALEVGPLPVGKDIVPAHPYYARGVQEWRGDKVHLLPAGLGQKIPGHQVNPPGAHFLLRTRPRPNVNKVDVQPQLLAQVLEQVGVGTDQLLRVLRVAPQVRGVFRVAGRGQPSAWLVRCGRQGQQQARQQQQGFAQATLDHLQPSAHVTSGDPAWWPKAATSCARPQHSSARAVDSLD
ncbi:hypothetical protein D3C81_1384620 [compost metagenome]